MILDPLFAHANTFMPPQGTEMATQYDTLYAFLLWASLISFIILVGGLIVFVLKYKRKSIEDKTAYITHNLFLEFLWSFIPFVIFMVVGIWGAVLFYQMTQDNENAIEIHVVAKKWNWEFMYKNGKKVTDSADDEGNRVFSTAIVPVNTPVKLIMTSREASKETKAVIHSFFIPAFRLKQDVLPGTYTKLNFVADKIGEFQVFCTEFCGDAHSKMLAKIKVVSQEEYDQWLVEETEFLQKMASMSPAELGKLVHQQNQCIGCHSVNGTKVVGPSFKGLIGASREFAAGDSGVADENYIRSSILNPSEKIVKGYGSAGSQSTMPTYKGVLSDEQISQVIEFIKTLK